MEKAEPNRGPEGRIYADSDGGWYYLVDILNNGDEKRVLSSNALFHVQEAAARWTSEDATWNTTMRDMLLIDGRTHKAIALYKKNEGLQSNWAGETDGKAVRRKEAYEQGRSLIHHNLPS